jgi:hypothetical protein
MIRRLLIVLVTLALTAVMGEIAFRRLDGYTVLSLALKPSASRRPAPIASRVRPDVRYLNEISLAPGVDRAWYEMSPPPIPRIPMDAAAQQRFDRYPTDPYGAFFAWNRNYLKQELCAGNTVGSLGILEDFYAYNPTEPGPYPVFRHLPHISPPDWFVTNSFGWRGPDLTLAKPRDTIRIAFVGASTTVSAYGLAFSHPEFVGHWLTLWASSQHLPYRFEVMNTGRTGIDSPSLAAIVRQELLPLDPDLVIAEINQLAPGKALEIPAHYAPAPAITFRRRRVVEDYSAVIQHLLTAASLWSARDGTEPPKPPYPTIWPADVDEQNPDVTHEPLPMDLHHVVADLESMRTSLQKIDSELAVTSSLWLVYPGMRLDLRRHLTLYRYLNDTDWPASYTHMRRMVDFQNRVFLNYARRHQLAVFDIAKDFPRDPDLFTDPIHMLEDGLRLQAWMYLQRLIPLIKTRIDEGRWPRAERIPAWNPANYNLQLANRKEILAQCH